MNTDKVNVWRVILGVIVTAAILGIWLFPVSSSGPWQMIGMGGESTGAYLYNQDTGDVWLVSGKQRALVTTQRAKPVKK